MWKTIFEDHDKVLLPLLILRLKQKQIKGDKQDKKYLKKTGRKIAEKQTQAQKSILNHSKNQEPAVDFVQKKFKNSKRKEQHINLQAGDNHPHNPYEKAFRSLLESEPEKGGIRAEVRELMIKNLSPIFQHDPGEVQNNNLEPPLPTTSDIHIFEVEDEIVQNIKVKGENDHFFDGILSTERHIRLDSARSKPQLKRVKNPQKSSRRSRVKWVTNARVRVGGANPGVQRKRIRKFGSENI